MTSDDVPAALATSRSKGLPETVYARIRDAIITGRLPPGSVLAEASLAEWLNVSRTPVREALLRATQEGLAERDGRRLRVRPRRLEEILQIYEVRCMAEGFAARAAAARHTPFDLAVIDSAFEASRSVDDPDDFAEAGRRLHRAIWQASHNPFLLEMLERGEIHLGRYPAQTLTIPHRREDNLDEHIRLIAAIKDGDGDKAEQVVVEHLTAGRDLRMRIYSEILEP